VRARGAGAFPGAELVEVASHWKIPQLADPALAEDWLRVKREILVLGVKKGLSMRPNGRSADFIAPSSSSGCAMACAYCYVGRRKGYANPISVFVNIDEVTRAIARHAARQGPKPKPNSIDPVDWVYDLGENGDLSVDAALSDNVRDLVAAFRTMPGAKGSFATKYVNRDLLGYDPQGRTRVRFSLMPETVAKVVDVRTSPVAERIAAINDFVSAGYEVHANFSPVIVHEGWEQDWKALFAELEAAVSPRRSRAAEVRGHFPDPQRGAARPQPQMAPASGGLAVATGHSGAQVESVGNAEPALQGQLEAAMAGAVSRLAGRGAALLRGPLRLLAQPSSSRLAS
jgi:spore photoproduct lyase